MKATICTLILLVSVLFSSTVVQAQALGYPLTVTVSATDDTNMWIYLYQPDSTVNVAVDSGRKIAFVELFKGDSTGTPIGADTVLGYNPNNPLQFQIPFTKEQTYYYLRGTIMYLPNSETNGSDWIIVRTPFLLEDCTHDSVSAVIPVALGPKLVCFASPSGSSINVLNIQSSYIGKPLKLYNILGEAVQTTVIDNNSMALNTSTLSSGVYLVSLGDNPRNMITKKIVLNK